MKNTSISVGATPSLPPLKHPWSRCITVGRAYELLRADLQEHLRELRRDFGYRHIRFHASFHDDVKVVQKLPNGEIVYRWTQLDHIYDFLVEAGFDPIVEINPMPAVLASGEKTMFWYKMNATPPAEMKEWERFMRAYILHTVERYGIERVRNWKFEVWNEPDLHGQFWTGDQQAYFDLYAACARVLKEVDPCLEVGGPATAGWTWALDLAAWCREKVVPLDFISYHCYPQNEACTYHGAEDCPYVPGMFFIQQVKRAKQELREAGFGDLPILMTEWNSLAASGEGKARWVGNETINNLFAGAAVCHLVTGCDEDLDIMGWWVASDVFEEGGPQVEPYSRRYQHYGMLTIDGLPKSSYHAFRFLNRLRGKRYEVHPGGKADRHLGCIVTDELAATRCLVWNTVFPDMEGADWTFTLPIPVSKSHVDAPSVRVTVAHVKEGRGSAWEFWIEMGEPAVLTRIEQEALAVRALPDCSSRMMKVVNGAVEVSLTLKPNEFALIELGGAPEGGGIEHTAEEKALDAALDGG